MLVAAAAVSLVAAQAPALSLKPCDVQTLRARCGVYRVQENRAKPNGRTIGLRVVVVPAWGKPRASDAFVFLAGGPGDAAAAHTYELASAFRAVNRRHDLLLVDQRGTGASNAFSVGSPQDLARFGGDPAQYGTRAAMDDLDGLRAALGYPKLDLYGISYGSTAAQVYVTRHPRSVRTVTLAGATALDLSFYGHLARNAQRALGQVARMCSADADCRRRFPTWQRQFHELVRSWDAHPVSNRPHERITGAGLAGVVEGMLLDVTSSVSIPLLVARAAKGDYGPLNRQLPQSTGNGPAGGGHSLMYWSIWCNEPWVGLGARGPWGTDFDGWVRASVEGYRRACSVFPKRPEPRSLWTFPHGSTPVLALAGGADPQDPLTNLPRLKRAFPDSRAVAIPFFGHNFPAAGCVGDLVAAFVDRGTTRRLDTSCVASMLAPPFPLTG